MFWKKNRTAPLSVSIDSKNQRSSYRVTPSENKPVYISMGDEKIPVAEISGHGFTFHHDHMKPAHTQKAALLLPNRSKAIEISFEITRKDPKNQCHCRFTEQSEEEEEIIFDYVLEREKEILREKKFLRRTEILSTSKKEKT